jgi:hypothetical protein
MGLFKPAWMTDNNRKSEKACVAVSKLTDQNELACVAMEAPLRDFAKLPWKNCSDQEVLKKTHYATATMAFA